MITELKDIVVDKDAENRFFKDEVELMESKIIYCHYNGFLDKIDPEYLIHYRKDI